MFERIDVEKIINQRIRTSFEDIVKLYYDKNYRECIVSLYSITVYDLFSKVTIMAESGIKQALTKLNELKKDIKENIHYSDIEKNIIEYFKLSFPVYFNHFIEDIEYLRTLRNKCAHLYLNDMELYIPDESKVRMLILSMYLNLFSISAPFISDIFDIAQNDIEMYSASLSDYLDNPKVIRQKLEDKYYKKMTPKSISTSLKTLFKLAFKSADETAKENHQGLYIFLDSLIDFCNKNGKAKLIEDANIESIIMKLEFIDINQHKRKGHLALLCNDYEVLYKMLQKNEELFNSMKKDIFAQTATLVKFKRFSEEYSFKELLYNVNPKIMDYQRFYEFLKNTVGFFSDEYCIEIVKRIPSFNGFDKANVVFDFILDNLSSISYTSLNEILKIHNENRQINDRDRAIDDLGKIREYLESKSITSTTLNDDEFHYINQLFN